MLSVGRSTFLFAESTAGTGTPKAPPSYKGQFLTGRVEINHDKHDDENDSSNPPNHFYPSRLRSLSELRTNKLVIVEFLVRQIHGIVSIGIFPPAGIVIRAALGTRQRTARNLLAADGTYIRCVQFGWLLSSHS